MKVPFSRCVMNKAEQSLASQIWQAIRKLKAFTLDAIAEQTALTKESVQGYVFWLRRAGYLVFNSKGFELIKDTGDRAPIATKSGFCDPNVA